MIKYMNDLYGDLQELQIICQRNALLKNYTTLHIGGNASILVEPRSLDELKQCIYKSKEYSIPYYVLGKGSNILALDEGYQGMVIVLATHFHHIESINETTVKAQSGARLKELCSYAYHHQLTGVEFACGIPGCVGGAIVMNAGAYGGEMKDVVKSVTYLDRDLELHTLRNEDLDFAYRHSYFSEHDGIVVEVEYKLRPGDPETIKDVMVDLMQRRFDRQPMDKHSAGSTFKRPTGYYASALIKEAGLQGLQVGGAVVSLKHAGFLINEDNATSEDFLMLIQEVKKRVKDHSGYDLEPEIKILTHHSR